MSLLLGLLGTTALMSATLSAPIATTISQEAQEPSSQGEGKRLLGIRQINKKVEVEAKAHGGKRKTAQEVKNDTIKFNWIDFGVIGVEDYLRIDWSKTFFGLSTELYYWNNVWGNSGTIERNTDYFTDLNLGFSFNIKYDLISEFGFGRLAENTREYTFADNFVSVTIDTKLWVLAKDKLAISRASITYLNLIYEIYLKY